MNNDFELSDEYKNSINTETCQVSLIGDKLTVRNIIKLLAYIRQAISNKANVTLKVNIGKNAIPQQFIFDVNNEQIPDLVIRESIDLN